MPARFELKNGIRFYPDGREVCVTAAAWSRRRRERLEIAGFRCEGTRACPRHRNQRCNNLLTGSISHATDAMMAHVHHENKGGRGLGGGKREDRLEKLEADCEFCHVDGHERDRFKGVRK